MKKRVAKKAIKKVAAKSNIKAKAKTKKVAKPAQSAKPAKAVKTRSMKSVLANRSDEKIGVLGGAFNPVHTGHLNAALTVREKLNLNHVAMIPTLNPPHRQMVTIEEQDRLDLLGAAIKSYEPELRIDDQEFKRGGTSYTVDTLEAYNKTHKADNIYFIMGADAFLDFPRWKNFEKLLSLANFVIVTRPGTNLTLSAVDLPSGLEQFVKASDNNHVILTTGRSILLVELEDIDVSSTELRKRLRNGHDVSKWMPERALNLINERALYKRSSPLVSDYREFALFCARRAFDKKGLDLKVYDMSKRNSYADYSVICSATSSKHGSSIGQGIIDIVKDEYGLAPISIEGLRDGQWVLVDYGAVVVHVFQDVVRQQYRIEDLWRACPQIQKEVDPKFFEKPKMPSRGAPQDR